MWPFSSKKTILRSGRLQGFCDCHCHLLPGVDDGIETMSRCLEALHQYEQWGINEVWLTPHIMEDIPNTTEELKQRFAKLQSEYKGPIRLRLCAEYMLDNLFQERFETSDFLTYGTDERQILVETSYMQPPIGFKDILKSIKERGMQPVLAHPERYVYMDEQDYTNLHSMGVMMQLNITSLVGAYGGEARRKAEWLVANGYYSFRGTDCHSIASLSRAVTKGKVRCW